MEEKDRLIEALRVEMVKKDKTIEALRAEIAGKDLDIEGRKRIIFDIRTRLDTILRSRTWRIGQVVGNAIHGTKVGNAIEKVIDSAIKLRHKKAYPAETEREAKESPKSDALPIGALIGNKYDIFFFPMIAFSFRYQRPQQLASYYAKRGHRVFYMNTDQFLNADYSAPFRIVEIKENIFEVFLKNHVHLDVYGGELTAKGLDILYTSLDGLRKEWGLTTTVGLVHNPLWTPLAFKMRNENGWKIVYDCLDEWGAFRGIGNFFLEKETSLVKGADLVTVTAELLRRKWSKENDTCTVVRNACDYEHFQKAVPNRLLDGVRKPIVGFFGGIADWIDIDMIRYAATQRKDWFFVLVGGIFTDVTEIENLPNVFLPGNQPYEHMPSYLYHFDACIIPFKKDKVTEAVDPVKLYEYFSLGKPVVARDLGEIRLLKDYLYVFSNREEFLESLGKALSEKDPQKRKRRREFAASNTWDERIDVMDSKVRSSYGKVSIIIVTFNNIELTRICVESILSKTDYPNFEVILVDNDSKDGTPDYLKDLARVHDFVKVILNDRNLGFAMANNLGIEESGGDYIVLLNNDTIVTKGWLTKFIHYLDKHPDIGLIGPCTNGCFNEARIDVPYAEMEGIDEFAYARALSHEGMLFDIGMLALYCTVMKRSIIEEVGLLDEIFGIGMFEDDDFSRRMKLAGYRVVCAEDIFIHHFGMAAFSKLVETGEYDRLFEKNKKLFEDKWGIVWEAHRQE